MLTSINTPSVWGKCHKKEASHVLPWVIFLPSLQHYFSCTLCRALLISESKDLLQRSHRETEIRSAHSRIILAEILSRPFALDLHNLFRCEKTILLLAEEKLNLL